MGSHGTCDSIAIKTTRDTKGPVTRKKRWISLLIGSFVWHTSSEKSPPREGSWSQSSFMLDVLKSQGTKEDNHLENIVKLFFWQQCLVFGVKLMEISSNGCFPVFVSSPNTAEVKRTQGFGKNYAYQVIQFVTFLSTSWRSRRTFEQGSRFSSSQNGHVCRIDR